ncbi:MAG: tetratricopeptide repeat protein [Deltaproteobacteria bacterium]|nr:tetratricopeptide repeat protein [Deltaproteobacteria bacterium]
MKHRFEMLFPGLLLTMSLALVSGCSRPAFLVGMGRGGKYLEARDQITRKRGGDIDKAIASLESVVREDPTYRDSLTLLGRAYYIKGRYQAAAQILDRALRVNPEDEIGWIVLGITQLRLGNDGTGMKTVEGGLTLFSKVSAEGYRGYTFWDRAGKVRSALRRTIVAARKGLEGKENLLRSVEGFLAVVDEEDWNQSIEQPIDRYGL